jgi:uncharacterized RDD family membrane protein YckC
MKDTDRQESGAVSGELKATGVRGDAVTSVSHAAGPVIILSAQMLLSFGEPDVEQPRAGSLYAERVTQPAGWYDDPRDPSLYRYWDGEIWSSHVSPKAAPPVPDQALGGQGPGQVSQQQAGWARPPATTPDGVLLAGWGVRAVARLLDGLFTFLLALPLTGWLFYRYITSAVDWSREMADQAAASGAVPVVPFPPWDVLKFAIAAGLVGLLVSASYEVFFLRRSGATPGKKILGISVRLRDRAGPPPMKTILGRTGFIFLMSLVSMGSLLDDLWPLWDEKKQALHDKVVATNVVVGSQPKRDR